MRLTITFIFLLTYLLVPASAHAEEKRAQCFVTKTNDSTIGCSGSTAHETSTSSSSKSSSPKRIRLQRRAGFSGVVDPQIVKLKELQNELFNNNDSVTDELLALEDEVCKDGKNKAVCVVPTPRVGGTPTPTPDTDKTQQLAQQAVESYFKEIPLPKPVPQMSSPKGGVCGAVHSLDLGIDNEYIYETETPQGVLELHVYGVSKVDWGDGKVESFNSTGAPFPNSDIDHFWINKGYYTIKADVSWTADWKIDGVGEGTVVGAVTSGSLENWRVYQLQAIITTETDR